MVRADFELEQSEDQELEYGGQKAGNSAKKRQTKTAKDRAAFFASRYGDKAKDAASQNAAELLSVQNKFSLSRIEWLEKLGL